MITILLEQIIELIKGWISAFTSHAQHVEDKLDSIDSTASDIKDNTDSLPDIEDNTAAVITPISNIKSNTDSIASSNTTIANNTTAISNQVSSLSTNVGRAAAYAEDTANNTLDILDKVTTIASDTTQIRTDSDNMVLEQSKIYDAVKWLLADKTIEETEEGQDSVTFNTDIADDINDLKVELVATQSGSGIPSPDNVRPISGYSSAELTVNGSTVTIALGDTYYGGVLDVIRGKLRINYGYKDLGSLTYTTQGTGYAQASLPEIKPNPTTTTISNIKCDKLMPDTQSNVYSRVNDNAVSGATSAQVRVYMSSLVGKTAAEIKTALSGFNLLYELATPIEIDITPAQIAAIKGDNTISTDTNGKVTVTYTESIKHYLDKQDN